MQITSLIIEITKKCNIRCKYCFYTDKERSSDYYLSIKDIQKILYDFPKCNTFYITGGEPLTNPDFYEIIKFLAKRGDVELFTNGILIENDKITKYCKYIYISVDDSQEDGHNLLRGKYKSTLNNSLKLLKSDPKKIVLKISIHSLNINRFIDIVTEYRKIGFCFFSINFIFSDEMDSISKKNHNSELEKIFNYIKMNSEIWIHLEYIMMLQDYFLYDKNLYQYCKAGKNIVYVDNKSSYYNCPEDQTEYPIKEDNHVNCFSENCLSLFELFNDHGYDK